MTPEDDELRFMRKVLAVAKTFHELSPDKQQEERLAELEQECPNPNVRSVLTGLRNYQAMGQLESFRACLRSDVQQEEDKKMSKVDRNTAAKLNPYISKDLCLDTCTLVAEALRGLSHMVDVCHYSGAQPNEAQIQQLLQDHLELLAGALEYESWHKEPKPEVEAPVKRVK